MNATITLNYNQVLQIVKQMPLREQLRLGKYLGKLKKNEPDPTLMTKEEFFAKIERAEKQIERGEYSVLHPGEDLTTLLRNEGYDI